jgi:hypothetical protein
MRCDSITANIWPKYEHTNILRQDEETEIFYGHVAEETSGTNKTEIGKLAVNIVREADQTLPLSLE